MMEGRINDHQHPPPPPSPSQAELSVTAEPYYAPYHHHQQHQQINTAQNTFPYGASYPAPPQHMMNNSPVTVVHCPLVEEKLSDDDQLPCSGIGIGWFLFILGFFFVLPWYIGVCFLLCSKYDNREKPGFIACTILAVIFLVLAVFDATKPVYVQA